MRIISRMMWIYIFQFVSVYCGNNPGKLANPNRQPQRAISLPQRAISLPDMLGVPIERFNQEIAPVEAPPVELPNVQPPPLPIQPAPTENSESEIVWNFQPPSQLRRGGKMEAAKEIFDELNRLIPEGLDNDLVNLIKCAFKSVVYEMLQKINTANYYTQFLTENKQLLNGLILIVLKYRTCDESNIDNLVKELKSNTIGQEIVRYRCTCYRSNGILWLRTTTNDRLISLFKDLMEFTDLEVSKLIFTHFKSILYDESNIKLVRTDLDEIQSFFCLIREYSDLFKLNDFNIRKLIIFGFLDNLKSLTVPEIQRQMDNLITDTLNNNIELTIKFFTLYFRMFLTRLEGSDHTTDLITRLNEKFLDWDSLASLQH